MPQLAPSQTVKFLLQVYTIKCTINSLVLFNIPIVKVYNSVPVHLSQVQAFEKVEHIPITCLHIRNWKVHKHI